LKDYLEIMYNKCESKTNYPLKLGGYLFNRFGFKKGQRFLEIGCGTGDFLKAFQGLGLDCSGVDISDCSVNNLKEFDVKKCDLEKDKLPYDDEVFDIVYSKSVIEHIMYSSNLMKEMIRVLKHGGKIIILTPDWKSQMNTFYNDFTHVKPYTEVSLSGLLSLYDFKNVQTEKFYQLPILWKYKFLKVFGKILQMFCSIEVARKMGKVRWLIELMVLGSATKRSKGE